MTTTAVIGDRDLSYEQLRMEKLKRNQQVMLSLGLLNQAKDKADEEVAKTKNEKKRKVDKVVSTGPRRRSPRLSEEISIPKSKPADNESDKTNEDEEEDELDDEQEYSYDVSKVMQYSCFSSSEDDVPAKEEPTRTKTPTLTAVGLGLNDNAIKRIYSISFHPNIPILAAGGHGGQVAIFSSIASNHSSSSTDSLLSFKASKGWISAVCLFGKSKPTLLVTSNSGEASLWDCSVERNKAPRKIFQDTLHHGYGIYDADLFESKIVSCSKEGSVTISDIVGSSIALVQRIEDAHSGVVKSTRFRPNSSGNIFASCGNDSAVRIWDARLHSKQKNQKASVEIFSKSAFAKNIVRWNPTTDHLILSASFQPFMELHDIRFPKASAITISGHVPAKVTRLSGIYQPIFVNGGENILASGGGSKHLTLFDSSTGAVLSSGYVGWEACAVGSLNGSKLAISHGSAISLFDCK